MNRSSSASSARRPGVPGATGSTSAGPRARSRSRSVTNCRSCWRASSPAAASRPKTSRASSIRPCARLMPDPSVLAGMAAAAARIADAVERGEDRRHLRRLRRRRRHRRRRRWRAFCATRARRRSSTSPTAFSKATGRTSKRSARSPDAARRLLVTVDCGTTSHEPLAEARTPRPRRDRDRSSPGRRDACRRRSRWSIRTGSTICRASAISPPSASCS